jgi:hypothetical protein
MAESKTSKRHIEAMELSAKAVALRRGGASYPDIASVLKVSVAGAYKAVMRALAETQAVTAEDAARVKELELARLDELLLGVYPSAKRGSMAALDRVLRIMERRSKFLGLDAPTKVAPTTPEGDAPYEALTDEERAARVVALLDAARARRNGQAAQEKGG